MGSMISQEGFMTINNAPITTPTDYNKSPIICAKAALTF